MNINISTPKMEVIMILPTYAFVYDSEAKYLEIGIYFLKFSFTIKISKK